MRKHEYQTRAGELGSLIVRLELKSEVPAAPAGRSQPDSDRDLGGNRPGGGIDYQDDREFESVLRSADHFRRRQKRCRTDHDFERVIADVEAALEAWEHTPPPVEGIDPERGSFFWKCRIADDDRPLDTIKSTFMVSRATVYRYRAKYRGLRSTRDAA